ncbi:unnamed protein product [Trifolium pratense]|uniref:Uncharacterized protein n=1 Tax=Trifolium pratense TaxID=57577 RepID=A0ACB0MDI1_TRIPR|nr:unnamed protein product [Trifolium pratense]
MHITFVKELYYIVRTASSRKSHKSVSAVLSGGGCHGHMARATHVDNPIHPIQSNLTTKLFPPSQEQHAIFQRILSV